MAVYEIIERSLDNGGLFVRARFWRNEAERAGRGRPHVESFYWPNAKVSGERIVTNASGHLKLKAGGFLDPSTVTGNAAPEGNLFVRETVAIDLVARVRAKLSAYARGLDYDATRRDRSDLRRPRTTLSDPRGLLPETTALQNERREV